MSYTTGNIKTEVHEKLLQCAEVKGRTYQSLVDEAMEDFAASFLVAYIRGAERRSGQA